jgi:hypothetical protein
VVLFEYPLEQIARHSCARILSLIDFDVLTMEAFFQAKLLFIFGS